MGIKSCSNQFLKVFLLLIFISTPTIHSRGCEIPLVVGGAGMRATIGCGGGAAVGSSFGPVGVVCGLVIGGFIGFLVKKYTHRVDIKFSGILFNESIGEVNKVPTKTVEDIIGESKPIGKTKGPSKQYEKEGSYEDALKDFESLAPQGVQRIEKNNIGKWGILPDGRRVVVRLESSGRVPTLEIQIPGQINKIKIRYVKC